MRFIFGTVLSLLLGAAVAQGPTLRERVARAHTDVALTVNVDGPVVTLEQILAETDLVVRGSVGRATAKLSADEREITTTYEIVNPQVSFSKSYAQAARPGLPTRVITVTQPGGTVSIGAFTATIRYDDAEMLKTGTDVIVLLRDDRESYAISGRAGMFEVRDARIVPLAKRRGEHQRFAGMTPEVFLVALRKALKQP